MPTDHQLLQIGRIGRAHGLKGEVVVKLTTNRLERVAPGAVLIVAGREMSVGSSRPSDRHHIVRFEGVDTRESAEAITNCDLFAAPIDDPTELWVHDLLGCHVFDADGTDRGVVESVEANPASDLLVLDNGALIPARFITEVADGRLDVDPPDGLFEL